MDKEDSLENKPKGIPKSGARLESGRSAFNYEWVGAIVLAVVIIAGLSYGYNVVTEKNRLTKLCNDYSLSPDLKYPTKCVPLLGDSSGGDYVDTRSSAMCRCTVELGNGTSTVIDVRATK